MWAAVLLGWPLLALAQMVLTPDVTGTSIGDASTLADVGFLIFIISVPAAVALTGFALVSRMTTVPTSPASISRAVGLAVAVLAVAFAAFMAAQLAAFFVLSPYIAEAFRLN
jgi:hypothetical protein